MELTTTPEQIHKPICVDRTSAIKPRCYSAHGHSGYGTARAAVSYPNSQSAARQPEPSASKDPAAPRIYTGRQRAEEKSAPIAEQAQESAHSAPRVERRTSVALWLAAVCGVAGGIIAAGAGGSADTLLCSGGGSFLALFLDRLLYCGAFLLAEYLLGFFALGEWVAWLVPLLCGLGAGYSAVGLLGIKGGGLLLVPAALSLVCVVFGAAKAERFSAQLLRVVSGSRTGIVLTNGSLRDYTTGYFGCAVLAVISALIEAAIKVTAG